MNRPPSSQGDVSAASEIRPNGAGTAAILAASVGAALVALCGILGDQSHLFRAFFTFSKSTGPLSGETTCAVAGWLICWGILHALWNKRQVNAKPITLIAFLLLALGVALTFPPIADLL